MSYIGNQPTTTAFLTDTFSANGSGTVFTLSAAPANTNSIIVAVSGVLQDPSTYSVSGTALTFSAAPPAGTGNISVRFLGIPASGIVNTAYRTQTEFTATAGQTTFSVPSYTVGFIDVYRNGALLGSADFTATNGTTVVLAAGASAGDLVETVSFYVSSVLNAIPATAGAVNSTYLLDGSVTQAKLGTGVAGNGPAFSASANSSQTISAGAHVKLTIFGTENFDTNNNFASNRFTPTVAGYYQISCAFGSNDGTSTILQAEIWKNGSTYALSGYSSNGVAYYNCNLSTLVYCNGSTDYIEFYGYSSATAQVGGSACMFTGSLTRAA
jgi:hypothetical protein